MLIAPIVVLPLAITLGVVLHERSPAQAPSQTEARTIFLRDCSVCHGADGKGTSKGPTLEGWGRAGVDYVLTTGRMPLPDPTAKTVRRPPKYDEPTIAALADYIATLVPGGPDIPDVNPDDGNLAAGGELYRAQCAACHQWSASGGALLHREAPALHASTATQIGEAVRTGPGAMPTFSDAALTDAQLNSVARYIQYLRSPTNAGGQPLWHLGPVAEGAVALVAAGGLLVVIRLLGSRP
jgi:ubiquinol-cytochrome c reductase cytochrome c subunit